MAYVMSPVRTNSFTNDFVDQVRNMMELYDVPVWLYCSRSFWVAMSEIQDNENIRTYKSCLEQFFTKFTERLQDLDFQKAVICETVTTILHNPDIRNRFEADKDYYIDPWADHIINNVRMFDN